MASKAQRAVTGVSYARWKQFGEALQAWREDVLGYPVRSRFADDRFVNLRLVQDLEKNYRPGTFTKWALQDAAEAYRIPYSPEDGPGSILAFLHGEAHALARVASKPAVAGALELPPAPFDDPAREAADRPYALAIWKGFLDLPRRVTEPTGTQMFPDNPDDVKTWDGIGARMSIGDRTWLIADLRRRAEGRNSDSRTA